MKHSKQCRRILNECDFKESNYIMIEQALINHTPNQIVSLVWSKDKNGEQEDFAYFLRSLIQLPKIKTINGDVIFTPDFISAYEELANFVDDDFDLSDFILIQDMSKDINRMLIAMNKSKPNIRYIYKVFNGIEPVQVNQPTILPKLQKNKVMTDELA